MEIASYLKTSLIEWPGKISSVIFVPGCNFRCPFCHNSDLVDPKKTKKLHLLSESEILKDLEKRKKWAEAVVVTGGEPTLQKDLVSFLKKIGKIGYQRMIHTNGTRPDVVACLIKNRLIDYIAMDLKGDLENYERYTNLQCKIYNVQKSMELVINSGLEYEFRTTIVPGLHDEKDLLKLAKELAEMILNCKLKISDSLISPLKVAQIENCRWYLQEFRPLNTLDQKYKEVKPFSKEEMQSFLSIIKKVVPETFLRGV